mmetsp:Transcript_82199/g.255469  ORF Transcript_82199/g.255469 Transcript_82199/m.255469 type:complete len:453 (-) Transcript_82199:239-1597(-)
MVEEEALSKTGAELFRELLRLYEGAEVEDYHKVGRWREDLIRTDIQLLAAHRKEAGAPEPPALEDVPLPKPPQPKLLFHGVVPPAQLVVPPPAVERGALDKMIASFVGQHQMDAKKGVGLFMGMEPHAQRFVVQNFKCTATGEAALQALERYIAAAPWEKVATTSKGAGPAPVAVPPKVGAKPKVVAPRLFAPGAEAARQAATPKIVAQGAAGEQAKAAPKPVGRIVPAKAAAAPGAGDADPGAGKGPADGIHRVVASFIVKHKLTPRRAQMMLAKLKPHQRMYVIRNFESASSGTQVTDDLEKYIEACRTTDAWAGEVARAEAEKAKEEERAREAELVAQEVAALAGVPDGTASSTPKAATAWAGNAAKAPRVVAPKGVVAPPKATVVSKAAMAPQAAVAPKGVAAPRGKAPVTIVAPKRTLSAPHPVQDSGKRPRLSAPAAAAAAAAAEA